MSRQRQLPQGSLHHEVLRQRNGRTDSPTVLRGRGRMEAANFEPRCCVITASSDSPRQREEAGEMPQQLEQNAPTTSAEPKRLYGSVESILVVVIDAIDRRFHRAVNT